MKDKILIPMRNVFLAAPAAMLSLGVYDILKGRSASRVLLNCAVAGTMFGAGCLYQLNALCSGKGTYHGELNFESENGTTQWKLSAVDDKCCCFDFKYGLDSESLKEENSREADQD